LEADEEPPLAEPPPDGALVEVLADELEGLAGPAK
jgi:hypothetical protein